MKIQEDFPQVSIPAANKLYTIIYEPNEAANIRVKKYVLEIKEAEDNAFYIDFYENIPKENTTIKNEGPQPQESLGKFTQKVLLKRNKKRPRN